MCAWKVWRSVVTEIGATIGALGIVAPTFAATLKIDPPAGFTVKQSTPDGGGEIGYEVASIGDADTGCQVTFTVAKPSGERDQGRINAEAAAPGYAADVRASLSDMFDVRRVDRFSMQGADGAVVIGDPKAGQGTIRSVITVVDTPRGKLQVMCVAAADEFDAWVPVFDRVARGVTLPR